MAAKHLLFLAPLLALGGCPSLSGSDGGSGSAKTCGPNFATPTYADVEDPSTGEDNLLLHWSGFPVRVHYINDITFDPGGLNISAVDVVTTARNRWTTASNGGVTFDEVGTPGQADIVVQFEHLDSQPSGGEALAFTQITYAPSTSTIFSAEITIHTWDGMTRNQFENGLKSTASHEFGHALFISGHSPLNIDLMYFAASASADKQISVQDRNTLETAYCGVYDDRSRDRIVPDDLKTITITCPAP